MARRALIVTYFFPPVGGGGVVRTLKYVMYLPRWGWQPVVIAPRDPGFPLRDPSLEASVPPEAEVHRTLSLEPARLVFWARGLRGRLGGRGGGAAVAPSAPADGADSAPATPPATSPFRRGLRFGAHAWARMWGTLLFPDEAIAWLPSAVRAAVLAHRRRPVAVVYSSGAPMSVHVVAGAIRRFVPRPWVADFRDPWVDNPFTPPPGPIRARLDASAERRVVEAADCVVVASQGMRDAYARRYPEIERKFVYIPNGYDSNDVAGLVPIPGPPGRFTILFAGSLYRRGELDAFLGGVERLLERRPDLRTRLLVQFVGRMNDENRRIGEEFTRPGRLDGVVTFESFVPRRQALARMAGADALLQLMTAEPGTEMFVGGKLYEYLAFDRPILAVMPPGEGRRLVEAIPTGRGADVEPGSVADALERLLDDPPARTPSDPEGTYDRQNLARRLAELLDEVVAESPRGGTSRARTASQ